LPDHATFANASVRKRRAAVARVVEKVIFAVAQQGIGGSLQRSVFIQFEQKAAIFRWQRRRAFLPKIDAHPPAVSGGNQETLRRPAMENQVERGWTKNSRGYEDGKAED
jgi:hypothetical protein